MNRAKELIFLGLVIFTFTCSCQTKEINETKDDFTLKNSEVTDSLHNWRDTSTWKIIIEETKNELESEDSWELRQTMVMLVNKEKDTTIVLPKMLVKHENYDGSIMPIIDAKFSPEFDGDMPRYIYVTVPLYATDCHIFKYDLKTGKYTNIHHGILCNILGSGNLYITYSGFREDSSGELIEGRGSFDAIVSPDGKVLWESEFYWD